MSRIEVDDSAEVVLSRSELDDRELAVLEAILEVEVEGHDGHRVIRDCTIDVERLVQAATLYDSIKRFRYDWRRGPPDVEHDARP